jgi:hypothetical protein
VTTEIISTHCRAGDLGFYRCTITNHSDKEVSWDKIQRRLPSWGMLHVTSIGGKIGSLSKHLTSENVIGRGMFPTVPRIYPGESWSFIGIFHIPLEHTSVDRSQRERFGIQIEVTQNGRDSETQSHYISLRHGVCDPATAKLIFEDGPSGAPWVPFNNVLLAPTNVGYVEPVIPRLMPGCNLRQFFEFIVDGTQIIEANDVMPARMESLLRKRAGTLNDGLREYITERLPAIVEVSLRERHDREVQRRSRAQHTSGPL